jgi:hypothetical protein
VLAEPARGVVATVQAGGISGPNVRERGRDRESRADCDPATQPQSETVGVGPRAETPKASAAFLCLSSLRNGALGEHGCKLRALNDRGDDSPEGMLTDGILDQLAKYERAKVAERTRRGLLQKAREGKIIKGPKANFGFRFNEMDDGLVIYEPEMRIVEKIFSMAASGMGPKAMQTRLYAEGIPSPTGKAMWPHRILKV